MSNVDHWPNRFSDFYDGAPDLINGFLEGKGSATCYRVSLGPRAGRIGELLARGWCPLSSSCSFLVLPLVVSRLNVCCPCFPASFSNLLHLSSATREGQERNGKAPWGGLCLTASALHQGSLIDPKPYIMTSLMLCRYFSLHTGPTSVDFQYVYRYPTWAHAGMNALNWAVGLSPLPEPSKKSKEHKRRRRSLLFSDEEEEQDLDEEEDVDLDDVDDEGQEGPWQSALPNGGGDFASHPRPLRLSPTKEPVDGEELAGGGRSLAKRKRRHSHRPDRHSPDMIVFNMCTWWGSKGSLSGLIK